MRTGKKIKNKIISAVLIAASLTALTGASAVWEGVGALAPVGALPERGFYISSNSYPKNTVVDVINLETGQTIQAIVQYSQNTPGGLVLLSRDAAGAIGVPESTTGRIRITSTNDSVANSLFFDGRDGRSFSGDPDFDPRAAVRSYALPNDASSYRPSATPPPYSIIGESRKDIPGPVPSASVAAAPFADTMPSIVSSPPLPLDPIVINMPPPVPLAVTADPPAAPAVSAAHAVPPPAGPEENPAASQDNPQISSSYLSPFGGESFPVRDLSPVPPEYAPDALKPPPAAAQNPADFGDHPQINSSFPSPLGDGESFRDISPISPALTAKAPDSAIPADNPEIAPLLPGPLDDSGILPLLPVPFDDSGLKTLAPAEPVELSAEDEPQDSSPFDIESFELGGILPLLPQTPDLKEDAARENALIEVVDIVDAPPAGTTALEGEEVLYDGPEVVDAGPAGSSVPAGALFFPDLAERDDVAAADTPPARDTGIEVVEITEDPAAGTTALSGEDVVFDSPEVVDAASIDPAAAVVVNDGPPGVWTDTPEVVDAGHFDPATGVSISTAPSAVWTDTKNEASTENPAGSADTPQGDALIEVVDVVDGPSAGTTTIKGADVVFDGPEVVDAEPVDPAAAVVVDDGPSRVWTDTPEVVDAGHFDSAAAVVVSDGPSGVWTDTPEVVDAGHFDSAAAVVVSEGPSGVWTDTPEAASGVNPPVSGENGFDMEAPPWATKAEEVPDEGGVVPVPGDDAEHFSYDSPKGLIVVMRPVGPKPPPVPIDEGELPQQYMIPAPSPVPEPVVAPENITLPDTARVSVLIRPPVPEPVELPENITLPDTAQVSVLIRPPVPEPHQKVETPVVPPVVSPVIPEPASPPSPSDAIPRIRNLERGKYYLQLGIYGRKEDIDKDITGLRKNLPLLIQDTSGDPALKLMVGPLNEGESNAMLLRLKKEGLKDAFIRHDG
jgi:hypothetical protein